jgi:hypothetical protein
VFNFITKKRKEEDVAVKSPYSITQEVFLATLDHRTCLICGVLDGKVFTVEEGPIPPLHVGCRCLRIGWLGDKNERPYVDPVAMARPKEGESPFYNSVGKTPVAKRIVGTTKDTYAQWFDRQKNTETGRKFQKIHLGPSRYAAYEAGKLSLDDMINFDTLEIFSLEELGLEAE